MTAQATNPNESSTQQTGTEIKLLAKKFKSVEDLESGYENLQSESSKVFNEKKALEDELTKLKAVPDDYTIDDETAKTLSAEGLTKLKAFAKKMGLPQEKFNEFGKAAVEEELDQKNVKEIKRAESLESLGVENVSKVKIFLQQKYPAKIADKMFNEAVMDKGLFDELMVLRNQTLNTQQPGIGMPPAAPQKVTDDDIKKAQAEVARTGSLDATNAYLALIKTKAGQAG